MPVTETAGVLRTPSASVLWEKRLQMEQDWRLHEGTEDDFRSWRKKAAIKCAILLVRCAGLYGRGRRNTRDFVFERHTFTFPALPLALDGFQILHLSDFHYSRFDTAFAEAVVELVRGVQADICLITGDYRYGYFGAVEYIEPLVQRVFQAIHVKYGTYGVFGNHDISGMIPGLERAGLTVLINGGRLIDVGGASLWVGGVDDAHWFRCASVPDALAGAPKDAFKILLAHTPENVAEAAALGFDFCLCGHTHGGQILFPVVGALMMNARCAREHTVGKWCCGDMQGYTTRGLGTTDIPLRFNCRPEATLIALKRGAEA
ncbi:MAG: metallophosphoesterase [Candidatus Hydrogenedentes bacterium]|nr:metallophosphoesterase [Candidatus Hydrogenedentota bacterium]